MYFKCCITNCGSKRKDVKLHKFPTDEDQKNKWLDCINSDSLKSVNVDKLLVCHKHFEKRFHTTKSGIKKSAYPTLFTVKEIEDGIPSKSFFDKDNKHVDHTYTRKRHFDHSYCKTQKYVFTDLTNMPSTSTSTIEYEGNMEILADLTNMPSTSTSTLEYEGHMDITADTMVASSSSVANNEPASANSILISPPRKKRLIRNFEQLTPKCKQLYKIFKKSKRQLNYNVRAKRALAFSKKNNFEEMTKNMNPIAKKMFAMQINICTKAKKGRRFKLEEKLIALSIYKQSPKAYRFLQKIFILPSNTTLKKLIAGLDIKTGINKQLFAVIKDEVSCWEEKKKYCTIMFDEMALEPALFYSNKNDNISGFVELNKKINNLADHALVFMARGAVCKWQQPVAFYFTEGAVSSQNLQIILKEIVNAVVETGLLPIALVSDQGSSFQSALKTLQENTRGEQIRAGIETDDTINISGASLSVIFDPPHLIKGLRNNFITKNIKMNGKISKWQDIVDVYQTDCKHTQSRLLHKINDEHVIPEKVKKMKVKNCVRVLSKTMAAALSYTAEFSHYSDGRPVSDTLQNTADTVAFFDNLFDSVNGSTLAHKNNKGKPLRKAVTANSPNHGFWQDAINKIKTIKFVDGSSEKSVPTLKNWVTTLKSYQRVWHVLNNNNIKVMRPRYFNSDPIENFFGRVRAYNFRNNDPTCHTFTSTFRSLLITGFMKFHNQTYNCEDDACSQLIKVQSLFVKRTEDRCNTSNIDSNIHENIVCVEDLSSENIRVQAARERLNVHSRAYTAGWVVKKIINKIKCKECETHLCTNEDNDVHRWISHREFQNIKKRKLIYPSEYAVRHFGYVIQESNGYLECNGQEENISTKIKNHILAKYPFDFLKCNDHKALVLEYFIQLSIKLCIYNWCNIINRILKGTDIIRLEKRTLPPMQKKVLNKYKKKLKNKSFNK
ncbi:uncharacterized protein LOC135071511 [Ostrinia nubilalis]|uniref:uncharacterized protein LOC135071511 n=1 Tax=Ostrinia nubilalis TaxID=29057 RepID=UPI0030824C4D